MKLAESGCRLPTDWQQFQCVQVGARALKLELTIQFVQKAFRSYRGGSASCRLAIKIICHDKPFGARAGNPWPLLRTIPLARCGPDISRGL